MASTSDAPSRTILQELNDLFSWNPPLLYFDPQKTKSTASRQPTYFDKHLSDDLILKRVVHVPSLVRNLAEIVDLALEKAKPSLPPSTKHFITAEQRDDIVGRRGTQVRSEKGVATFFERTTAEFCPPVASTLLLHPGAVPPWQSLIQYTSDVSSSGYAINDGEHAFIPQSLETIAGRNREKILEDMGVDTRNIIQKMRESRTPLTTFELKGLTVGRAKVMHGITGMSEFSWECCEFNPCEEANHKRGRNQAAQIVRGLDASRPPWNFLVCSYTLYSTFCSSYRLKDSRSTTQAGDAPPLATALAMEQGEVSGHTGAGPSTMSPMATRQSTAVVTAGPSIAAPSSALPSHRTEKRKGPTPAKSKAPKSSHSSQTLRATRSATKAGVASLATTPVEEPRRMKTIGMKGKSSVRTGAGPSTMSPPSTIVPLSSEEPTSVKAKGKKRQRFDDVNDNDDGDSAYKDPGNLPYEVPTDLPYEVPTNKDPIASDATALSYLQQVTV